MTRSVDPAPVSLLQLTSALGLVTGGHVAIVGGGGKTTLLHTLGRGMRAPTILTSTTKMGTDQTFDLPVLIDPTDEALAASLGQSSPVMVWSGTEDTKAIGVSPETCDRWFAELGNVVIEADGARRRPFKAPLEYEPVVPESISSMVSVIGLDALGHSIAERCHRPDRVAEIAECSTADPLTPARAATVLLHPEGARRQLPPGASFSIVITKVRPSDQELAGTLVGELEERTDATVVAVEFDAGVAGAD